MLLGDLGEQRQRGKPDQESIRSGPGVLTKHGLERGALWGGQPVEAIQHRRAELMERAEGSSISDPTPVELATCQPATRSETYPSKALFPAPVSPRRNGSAPTGERVCEGRVKRLAVDLTSDETHGSPRDTEVELDEESGFSSLCQPAMSCWPPSMS